MSAAADLAPHLRRLSQGEAGAREALFAAAYPELKKLARARLRDGGRCTVLDTTALVNESFMRFIKGAPLASDDRRAFFAYAGQVMHSVIIDTVRERQAQRRGGGLQRVTLDTQVGERARDGEAEVLAMHEALTSLAEATPRLAQVVQMRYFAGFSDTEIADTLGVTDRTVRRDWEKARLLLAQMLKD